MSALTAAPSTTESRVIAAMGQILFHLGASIEAAHDERDEAHGHYHMGLVQALMAAHKFALRTVEDGKVVDAGVPNGFSMIVPETDDAPALGIVIKVTTDSFRLGPGPSSDLH